ncbi:hypothetical protein [Rhodanobacter sp. A1T4]|jgi:hypothetical protein|uniref:hypothetical protein n=1 Tax=Rhodanobacter sp. A1T4 TaxID=2723087 RepID=UPI00161F8D5B|nr:hypothetical protein [Rhodanobacter sp. A1T4]MBB6248482.1 hypothetical protein [Rhodanobacter sp. A1T4]
MRRFIPMFSLFVSLSPIMALAQQVWFAPPDNLQRGTKPPINQDFPHLFDPSPAWGVQADVFLISPFLGSVAGPEATLRTINAFSTRHHMAFAVGIGAAQVDNENPVPGECGFGVEGMNRPKRNAITFKRLKSLGIDVHYVSMDEPLTFAHYYDKKNACRYSIEETARRVAASIAEIRQFYPNVKVVDVEAPNITSPQQWNADFQQWLDAYRLATGTPLDAVVFDADWRLPWMSWVAPSTAVLHRNKVHAGIIIDGTGPGASDQDSIAARKQNALSVQKSKLPFDIVEIANWTPHPSRNLPESDPDTLTSFLHWYQTRRLEPGQ